MGVPDLKFINRKVPIIDVARALDLRIGTNENIHCWRPELHQHGDRTASVGIRKTNNTVKCFGCDIGPLGPVDLVMAVRGLTNPGGAAQWIANRSKRAGFASRKASGSAGTAHLPVWIRKRNRLARPFWAMGDAVANCSRARARFA